MKSLFRASKFPWGINKFVYELDQIPFHLSSHGSLRALEGNHHYPVVFHLFEDHDNTSSHHIPHRQHDSIKLAEVRPFEHLLSVASSPLPIAISNLILRFAGDDSWHKKGSFEKEWSENDGKWRLSVTILDTRKVHLRRNDLKMMGSGDCRSH